jgi:hypothetical protein
MSEGKSDKPDITLSVHDIRKIKELSQKYFFENFPGKFDQKEIQVLLICQGFLDFLSYEKIDLPFNIKLEWKQK